MSLPKTAVNCCFRGFVRNCTLVRLLFWEVNTSMYKGRKHVNIKHIFVTTLAVVNLMTTSVAANTGDQIARDYAVAPSNHAVDSHYVEQVVMAYFHDLPVMIAIASCESEFRQYEENGQLLVNPSPNSSATGVYQILYTTHRGRWSVSLETNITTLEGNLAFARQLYEESGTASWNESRSCWQGQIGRYELRVAQLPTS